MEPTSVSMTAVGGRPTSGELAHRSGKPVLDARAQVLDAPSNSWLPTTPTSTPRSAAAVKPASPPESVASAPGAAKSPASAQMVGPSSRSLSTVRLNPLPPGSEPEDVGDGK